MRFKQFTTVACCITIFLGCKSQAQKTDLSIEAFEKGINQSVVQILDVRTPAEYQSGHLKNAFLADWNNQPEFTQRVKALDKTKPVYTYCLSGYRSAEATQYLKQNGFVAYNLAGGIMAWKNQKKPLEQNTPVKQMTLDQYLAQIPTDKTVLVDFSATWCPPCKKMTPIIDSLAKSNASQFVLVKVDGGQQEQICRQLGVEGFPTFIVYKQGKEVWRTTGLVEAKTLKAQL